MPDLIVYIDDEPALCRVAELLLRHAGLDVRAFTDPEQALAFLEQDSPVTAVVCDLRMPRMTGQELLARLRRDVPFVLVTGDQSSSVGPRDDRRVRALVEKPFKFPDLLALLRALPPPPS